MKQHEAPTERQFLIAIYICCAFIGNLGICFVRKEVKVKFDFRMHFFFRISCYYGIEKSLYGLH